MRVNSTNVVQIVSSSFSSFPVTITSGSDQPLTVVPKPVPTSECDNPDPAWIFCDDFEVNRMTSYRETSSLHGRLLRVDGVGRNGSYGMQTKYDPAHSVYTSGSGKLELTFGRVPPGLSGRPPVDGGTVDYRQIYWRFFVRTDPDWEGGNGEKLTRASVYTSSSRAQAMIAHAWAYNNRQDRFLLDPSRGTNAEGTVVLTTKWNDEPNLTTGERRTYVAYPPGSPFRSTAQPIPTNGEWVCLEFMVKLNDAGQSNGEFWLWKNEVVIAQFTDYNYLGAYNAYGINMIMLEDFMGTPDADYPNNIGPPKLQYRYYDNFVVSTQRIGCRG